ncbi:MAG TPA: undecaprenyl-phosphate glucose phosphotransferase [Lachnospiraceae bacterium]|nr:undecaprenyl-phosphate glucose phosphotransferase [Lachnospiraceae bacterium]
MIRDNQRVLNQIHVLLDAFVIGASYLLAWYIKFVVFRNEADVGVGVLPQETYFTALYFIVPIYLVLYYCCGLYMSKRYSSSKREVYNIIKANTIGLGLFFGILFGAKIIDFSRSMIFIFFVLASIFEICVRQWLRKILRTIRKKGYNIKYILLVGYSRAAEKYINRIMENPQWGYVVCGILDDKIPAGAMYRGVKVLGRIDNIHVILPENKIDEIGISLALEDYDRLEELVNICEKSGVHTKFIPDYNSVIPSRPYIEDLTGLAVINIRHVPLTNTANIFLKRTVDLFGAVFCIILFSPVMLFSAILIKISDGGKVIFSQERVGLHNKSFQMYKFRTMREQKEEDEKLGWTKKGDPRVTPIGRFLRRTSLDELPQMFNVLRGDMSLIGPRPERPQFVEQFREEIPRYMIKHQVRPGITGWAQINGYRGNTSIRKRIEFDLYYIENWTLLFDIKILFLTMFKGFINKNAY